MLGIDSLVSPPPFSVKRCKDVDVLNKLKYARVGAVPRRGITGRNRGNWWTVNGFCRQTGSAYLRTYCHAAGVYRIP